MIQELEYNKVSLRAWPVLRGKKKTDPVAKMEVSQTNIKEIVLFHSAATVTKICRKCNNWYITKGLIGAREDEKKPYSDCCQKAEFFFSALPGNWMFAFHPHLTVNETKCYKLKLRFSSVN